MSIEINDDNFLDKLLEIVNTITYVENVYVDNDIYYANYGSSLPSDDEISDVNEILDNWSTNKERFVKLDNEKANLESNIQSGYSVPSDLLSGDSGGWNLNLDTDSLANLSLQYIIAENNNASSVSIVDASGQSRTLSLSNVRLLMSSYGNAVQTIKVNYANNVKNINDTFNGYDGGGQYSNLTP